jgi:hypothetical protein
MQVDRGLNHKQPFPSGHRPSAGTRHPRGFFAARGKLWLQRGRRQRRRPHPGAGEGGGGGPSLWQFHSLRCCGRDSEAIGLCVVLQGSWGCPARQKRESKPRKASELDRPRAKRTQRPGLDQPGSDSQPGATVTKRRCLAEQPLPPGLQRPHGCPSHAARAGTVVAVVIPHKLRTRTTAGEWPHTCARWPRGEWWWRVASCRPAVPAPTRPYPALGLASSRPGRRRLWFLVSWPWGGDLDPAARAFLVHTWNASLQMMSGFQEPTSLVLRGAPRRLRGMSRREGRETGKSTFILEGKGRKGLSRCCIDAL